MVALCTSGPAQADVASLVEEIRTRQAKVLVVGGGEGADVSLPGDVPEPLAPIVAVVRGQQLAHELATVLGHEPDSPPGLSKITAT